MVVLVNTIQGHLDDHAMETGLTLLSRAERQSTRPCLLFQKVCSWRVGEWIGKLWFIRSTVKHALPQLHMLLLAVVAN